MLGRYISLRICCFRDFTRKEIVFNNWMPTTSNNSVPYSCSANDRLKSRQLFRMVNYSWPDKLRVSFSRSILILIGAVYSDFVPRGWFHPSAKHAVVPYSVKRIRIEIDNHVGFFFHKFCISMFGQKSHRYEKKNLTIWVSPVSCAETNI